LFIFLVVYLCDKRKDDVGMTREELRRENARKLASGEGGKASFARLVSMEPSQVSQLIGPNPTKNIGNSIARRIERAHHLPDGWLDMQHDESRVGDHDGAVTADNEQAARVGEGAAKFVDDEGFVVDDAVGQANGLRVRVGNVVETVPIRAVKLKLQAGVSGFVEEPDMDIDHGIFQVPKYVIDQLQLNPANLMIMTVKGRSMEPLYFEDGKVLVDTSKRTPKNNECFAVNWNGELIVKCLIKKSNGWSLYSINRDPQYHTIDVRTGQCSIIGQVLWQPDRIVTGLL
jgi:phage repressor protein C with HTH and peptisase S24 domain